MCAVVFGALSVKSLMTTSPLPWIVSLSTVSPGFGWYWQNPKLVASKRMNKKYSRFIAVTI